MQTYAFWSGLSTLYARPIIWSMKPPKIKQDLGIVKHAQGTPWWNPLATEPEGTPWWAPLAAGAGLGLGAYGLARTPLLASAAKYPILRKIQEMAGGKMLREGIRGGPREPTRVQKLVRSILHGPEVGSEIPKALRGTAQKPTAVWSGNIERLPKGVFDPSLGPVTGAQARRNYELAEMLEDKLIQSQVLAKFAPGTSARTVSVPDVLKKYNLKLRRGKNLEGDLRKLQDALRKEFGEQGFIIKPREGAASSGVFPTHKTDLVTARKQWKQLEKEAPVYLDDAAIRELRKRPGYEGRVIDELLDEGAIIQEMLPIQRHAKGVASKMREKGFGPTKEYRVHVVGGRAVPSMAVPRYPTDILRMVPEYFKARQAARWAQKHVIDKLPQQQREIAYGMDIAPLVGKGKKDFRVIEMNPGGLSGLLDVPITGNPALYRAVTGRSTPAMAGLAGLGGFGAGVAGTEALL